MACRVPGCGLKICTLDSAVHDSQLVTRLRGRSRFGAAKARNTQRKKTNGTKLIEIESACDGLPSFRT